MAKKGNKAIAKYMRFMTGLLTIIILFFTIQTVLTSLQLIIISEQNIRVETWRINPDGIKAANQVYAENSKHRELIYNSNNSYIKWFATNNKFIQLIVGFSLIALSFSLIYLWSEYFTKKYFTKSSNNIRKKIFVQKNKIHFKNKSA